MGVTIGVGEQRGVGVAVGVDEATGLGDDEAPGLGVAVGVDEVTGLGVDEATGLGVDEASGLGVAVGVDDMPGLGVAVGVDDAPGIAVGVVVAIGDAEGTLQIPEMLDCPTVPLHVVPAGTPGIGEFPPTLHPIKTVVQIKRSVKRDCECLIMRIRVPPKKGI